jgi:SNF2 family DNA or RNA helicase
MEFRIEHYAWPAFMGRRPFEHQRVTVSFLLGNKRAYVLNEQGTGKTLSALWAADILMCAGRIKRVLIIGPLSSLRSVWYREIAMNLPHRKVVIAHGNSSVRTAAIYDSTAQFVVINHDGVRFAEDELIKAKFDLVIIDELTAYKSHGAERSKAMLRVSHSVKAVWGMTGNLTPNSPTEAFFPGKIVNPQNGYLPRYFTQFRDVTMTQINEYLWVPKPEAPRAVALCIQPAIRYTRDECLDLPDTTYQVVEVPLSKQQVDHYEEMRKQAYIECESGAISAVNAGVKLGKLLQISAGSVRSDEGNVVELDCKSRLDALFDLFEDTPQGKLVVFATYRATIAMLERECQKRGVRCASIHGDVAQNLRSQHIERFQTGDLQMIVLQPQTAAHSITLTAASTMVWFSLTSSNELFEQGCARIVRAGQVRKTLIYMFVSTRAEQHVAALLERRQSVSNATLDLFLNREL